MTEPPPATPATKTIRIVGAEPGDQVWRDDVLGMINVSRMARLIPAAHPLTRVPIGEAGLDETLAAKLDASVVKAMTPERRDQPCIVLAHEGVLTVIDGNHRVARRLQDGFDHVMAHAVTIAAFERFRVEFVVEPEHE